MEVRWPILAAFNYSKEHHSYSYWGKKKKKRKQNTFPLPNFFYLCSNERLNPTASLEFHIMIPRHMLLNTFHWPTVSSSTPTQTCFRIKTDSVSVLENAWTTCASETILILTDKPTDFSLRNRTSQNQYFVTCFLLVSRLSIKFSFIRQHILLLLETI